MGKGARIATVCQGGHFKPTVEGNRKHVLGLLDRALEERPDLVCLPEAFHNVGVTGVPRDTAELLSGSTIEAVALRAKNASCYVVCPIHTLDGDQVFNSAVVVGRDGAIVGIYNKVCPVTSSADYTELESGVTRGSSLPVFDLDFGRVGIQICFDVGFPENWQALADAGARLVLWPSAYDGGFPLRAYAYLHHYYVVSSTRSGRSRIVDPCGEILAETTDANPVIFRDVNLDFVVSHLDWNMGIQDKIREKYGDRVEIRQWDPGSAHFVVEPKDPSLSAAQLQQELGFESTREYHNRHRSTYRQMAAGDSPIPQQALHGERAQYGK